MTPSTPPLPAPPAPVVDATLVRMKRTRQPLPVVIATNARRANDGLVAFAALIEEAPHGRA